jgi:hypothetical protein
MFMSEAKEVERSLEGMARRLLLVNIAAIHSTSLASGDMEPLCQEVDAVITEEGWTKAGIDKMHKIDSFLRETQRVDGLNLRSLDSFPSIPSTRC